MGNICVEYVGETTVTAKAGECTDEMHIRKVDVFNEEYRLKETGDVLNWFEITTPEGYLSINDKVSDIAATFRGKILLASLAKRLLKDAKKEGNKGAGKPGKDILHQPRCLLKIFRTLIKKCHSLFSVSAFYQRIKSF